MGIASRQGTLGSNPAVFALANIVDANPVLAKRRTARMRAISARPINSTGAGAVLANAMPGALIRTRGDVAGVAAPPFEAMAPFVDVADAVPRTLLGTVSPGAVLPGMPGLAFTKSEIVAASCVGAIGWTACWRATIYAAEARAAHTLVVLVAEPVATASAHIILGMRAQGLGRGPK